MDKLFVFDIDGTLLRTGGAGKRSFNKAFNDVFGIEDGFKNVSMHGMLDPIIFKNALITHNIEDKKEHYVSFRKKYIDYLIKETDDISDWKTVSGVKEFLEANKDKALFVLLTGNIFEGAKIKLSTLGLWDYFPNPENGAFGEDADERIYLGERVLEKLDKKMGLKFKPENIVVFGDTKHDIAVAKHINAKSVALSSGGISIEELSKHNPDVLANNFTEIKDFSI